MIPGANDDMAPQDIDDAELGEQARGFAKTLHARATLPPGQSVLSTGEVIGGVYQIDKLIGEGGMSEVYAARDLVLKRPVAIKAALPEVETGLLRQEAVFLAAFRHPGLVSVYNFGVHRDIEYIVMERLTGMNLADHIDRRGGKTAFSIDEALDILYGITEALSVLHNAGLAHRDLKPENIMLEPHGRIVLLDFGITRQERFIAAEQGVTGTPEYIAPESVVGQLKPGRTHLVDIYALGITAYELLAGQPPFIADKAVDVLMMHVRTTPPNLTSIRRDVPANVRRLISEMLAKDPFDRPPSIDMIRAELRAIRANTALQAEQAPLQVLIADDEPLAAELLRAIILQVVPNAVIRTAANGEEALEMFHEEAPEIAFFDLDMPRMNGMELCMYLKGTRVADNTVLIVVSSHADENKLALQQLGVADAVAKKHDDPDKLADAIEAILTRVTRSRTSRATLG